MTGTFTFNDRELFYPALRFAKVTDDDFYLQGGEQAVASFPA
jgi:hypothetical protein